MPKSIVWFRQDLRLSDNPALTAAAKRGDVVPVFIREPDGDDYVTPGAASKWWLHHSLTALEKSLGNLVYFSGDPLEQIGRLLDDTGADAVYWNRCYEPHAIERDKRIKSELKEGGITVQSFNAALLHEPWEIETNAGEPYKVFTPFWRSLRPMDKDEPLPKPKALSVSGSRLSEKLDTWELLPKKPNWAKGWEDIWTPGEKGAQERLDDFVDETLADYAKRRDLPAKEVTSRLSAHLHFGEISPRQIWQRINFAIEDDQSLQKPADKFLSEVAWREFSHHLIYHFPKLPKENWKDRFDAFPWRDADDDLEKWQKGLTGYPMVDAGMRELWATGIMHNRVRMITASFLIKHLRIDWRIGQRWFWDTLVDADLANNAAGWQWVAGSGADASPFFRIFNPITQGEKFDPEGDYIRKWCPELEKLDTAYIHSPWEAPEDALKNAGITLGDTYPHPMVEHKKARQAALEAYENVKDS